MAAPWGSVGTISPTQTALLLRTSQPHTVILSLTQGSPSALGLHSTAGVHTFPVCSTTEGSATDPNPAGPTAEAPIPVLIGSSHIKEAPSHSWTPQTHHPEVSQLLPRRPHRNYSSVGAAPLKQPPAHTYIPPPPPLSAHPTAVIPINSHPFPSIRRVFIQLHTQTNRLFPLPRSPK